MALYLALPLAEPERLANALSAVVAVGDRYALKNGAWIVNYTGTSRELSDLVGTTGVDPAKTGSVLYSSMGGYYGRGPTEMWEWIKSRLEK